MSASDSGSVAFADDSSLGSRPGLAPDIGNERKLESGSQSSVGPAVSSDPEPARAEQGRLRRIKVNESEDDGLSTAQTDTLSFDKSSSDKSGSSSPSGAKTPTAKDVARLSGGSKPTGSVDDVFMESLSSGASHPVVKPVTESKSPAPAVIPTPSGSGVTSSTDNVRLMDLVPANRNAGQQQAFDPSSAVESNSSSSLSPERRARVAKLPPDGMAVRVLAATNFARSDVLLVLDWDNGMVGDSRSPSSLDGDSIESQRGYWRMQIPKRGDAIINNTRALWLNTLATRVQLIILSEQRAEIVHMLIDVVAEYSVGDKLKVYSHPIDFESKAKFIYNHIAQYAALAGLSRLFLFGKDVEELAQNSGLHGPDNFVVTATNVTQETMIPSVMDLLTDGAARLDDPSAIHAAIINIDDDDEDVPMAEENVLSEYDSSVASAKTPRNGRALVPTPAVSRRTKPAPIDMANPEALTARGRRILARTASRAASLHPQQSVSVADSDTRYHDKTSIDARSQGAGDDVDVVMGGQSDPILVESSAGSEQPAASVTVTEHTTPLASDVDSDEEKLPKGPSIIHVPDALGLPEPDSDSGASVVSLIEDGTSKGVKRGKPSKSGSESKSFDGVNKSVSTRASAKRRAASADSINDALSRLKASSIDRRDMLIVLDWDNGIAKHPRARGASQSSESTVSYWADTATEAAARRIIPRLRAEWLNQLSDRTQLIIMSSQSAYVVKAIINKALGAGNPISDEIKVHTTQPPALPLRKFVRSIIPNAAIRGEFDRLYFFGKNADAIFDGDVPFEPENFYVRAMDVRTASLPRKVMDLFLDGTIVPGGSAVSRISITDADSVAPQSMSARSVGSLEDLGTGPSPMQESDLSAPSSVPVPASQADGSKSAHDAFELTTTRSQRDTFERSANEAKAQLAAISSDVKERDDTITELESTASEANDEIKRSEQQMKTMRAAIETAEVFKETAGKTLAERDATIKTMAQAERDGKTASDQTALELKTANDNGARVAATKLADALLSNTGLAAEVSRLKKAAEEHKKRDDQDDCSEKLKLLKGELATAGRTAEQELKNTNETATGLRNNIATLTTDLAAEVVKVAQRQKTIQDNKEAFGEERIEATNHARTSAKTAKGVFDEALARQATDSDTVLADLRRTLKQECDERVKELERVNVESERKAVQALAGEVQELKTENDELKAAAVTHADDDKNQKEDIRGLKTNLAAAKLELKTCRDTLDACRRSRENATALSLRQQTRATAKEAELTEQIAKAAIDLQNLRGEIQKLQQATGQDDMSDVLGTVQSNASSASVLTDSKDATATGLVAARSSLHKIGQLFGFDTKVHPVGQLPGIVKKRMSALTQEAEANRRSSARSSASAMDATDDMPPLEREEPLGIFSQASSSSSSSVGSARSGDRSTLRRKRPKSEPDSEQKQDDSTLDDAYGSSNQPASMEDSLPMGLKPVKSEPKSVKSEPLKTLGRDGDPGRGRRGGGGNHQGNNDTHDDVRGMNQSDDVGDSICQRELAALTLIATSVGYREGGFEGLPGAVDDVLDARNTEIATLGAQLTRLRGSADSDSKQPAATGRSRSPSRPQPDQRSALRGDDDDARSAQLAQTRRGGGLVERLQACEKEKHDYFVFLDNLFTAADVPLSASALDVTGSVNRLATDIRRWRAAEELKLNDNKSNSVPVQDANIRKQVEHLMADIRKAREGQHAFRVRLSAIFTTAGFKEVDFIRSPNEAFMRILTIVKDAKKRYDEEDANGESPREVILQQRLTAAVAERDATEAHRASLHRYMTQIFVATRIPKNDIDNRFDEVLKTIVQVITNIRKLRLVKPGDQKQGVRSVIIDEVPIQLDDAEALQTAIDGLNDREAEIGSKVSLMSEGIQRLVRERDYNRRKVIDAMETLGGSSGINPYPEFGVSHGSSFSIDNLLAMMQLTMGVRQSEAVEIPVGNGQLQPDIVSMHLAVQSDVSINATILSNRFRRSMAERTDGMPYQLLSRYAGLFVDMVRSRANELDLQVFGSRRRSNEDTGVLLKNTIMLAIGDDQSTPEAVKREVVKSRLFFYSSDDITAQVKFPSAMYDFMIVIARTQQELWSRVARVTAALHARTEPWGTVRIFAVSIAENADEKVGMNELVNPEVTEMDNPSMGMYEILTVRSYESVRIMVYQILLFRAMMFIRNPSELYQMAPSRTQDFIIALDKGSHGNALAFIQVNGPLPAGDAHGRGHIRSIDD